MVKISESAGCDVIKHKGTFLTEVFLEPENLETVC